MILDLLNFIFGTILRIIAGIFASIDFVLPEEIPNAIEWLFAQGNYFTGIFPVGTLYMALLTYISAYGSLYVLKLFIMSFKMIPWIGSHIDVHLGKK